MSEQNKGGLGRGLSALLPKVTLNPPAGGKTHEVPIDADRGEKGRADDRSDRRDSRADEDRRAPRANEPGGVTSGDAPTVVQGDTRLGAPRSGDAQLGVIRELPIDQIRPNPKQPRTEFDDDRLGELAQSIQELGVLQPVLVRETDDGFELVAGERRLRASLRAGRRTIPAIVRHREDDVLLLEALVENIQRVELNPLDEAAALRGLVDDLGITHDEVAKRIGKSRAAVTNSLRLLTLGGEVQRRVRDGSLSAAHARALASLTDTEQQTRAVRRIIADGLSVRATERLVVTMTAEGAKLTQRATATRAARKGKADAPPGVLESEMLLSDHLETSVSVTYRSDGGGQIDIRYAGLEDLDRIVRAILDRAESGLATETGRATGGGQVVGAGRASDAADIEEEEGDD